MVSKIVSVLATLSQAGIRAKRGTLSEKAIRPESPVAVIYPERSVSDLLTLAVEVFGTNAVQCEDTAISVVEALKGMRAGCTMEKCRYSGKTGLFSVKILASWPVALAQKVYLDGSRLSNVIGFSAEACYRELIGDSGSTTQWVWTLTVEELLPEGKAPVADYSGSHAIRVVTDGGAELFSDGTWISVQRRGDARGTVQTRVLQCGSHTVES